MIEWGMRTNFLTFDGKYYLYGREEDLEDKGISIGAYEGAFMADLVATYILANTTELFIHKTIFAGIYRDDGLLVWNKIMDEVELDSWLTTFQNKVNELLDSEKLVFSIET